MKYLFEEKIVLEEYISQFNKEFIKSIKKSNMRMKLAEKFLLKDLENRSTNRPDNFS
jgi:hypothetical protein